MERVSVAGIGSILRVPPCPGLAGGRDQGPEVNPLGQFRPRLCENSVACSEPLNFEAYGPRRSQKNAKISHPRSDIDYRVEFSHSLGPEAEVPRLRRKSRWSEGFGECVVLEDMS